MRSNSCVDCGWGLYKVWIVGSKSDWLIPMSGGDKKSLCTNCGVFTQAYGWLYSDLFTPFLTFLTALVDVFSTKSTGPINITTV